MIKVTRRIVATGAGALAVVALGAGTTLFTGLPGGAARADDNPPPDKVNQIIKDCDHPQYVGDGTSGGMGAPIIHSNPNPACDVTVTSEVTEGGPFFGPADKHWFEGKEHEQPACDQKVTMTASKAHTTGTNFTAGFQVGVDKELPGKIKPQLQARFSWTEVNTDTETAGVTAEVQPYTIGWFERQQQLRKFKEDITATYIAGDETGKTYHLKDIDQTAPDGSKDENWVAHHRDMTEADIKAYNCPPKPAPSNGPSPTDSPTGSPTTAPPPPPAGPQGKKSLVNVGNGTAADVADGDELHAQPANSSDGQKWNLTTGSDGLTQLEPVTKPGWGLGHNTDATKMDQGIQPYAFIAQGAGEGWRLSDAGGGAFTIKDGDGDCLTAPGNPGGTIGVFGCVGGGLQSWKRNDA